MTQINPKPLYDGFVPICCPKCQHWDGAACELQPRCERVCEPQVEIMAESLEALKQFVGLDGLKRLVGASDDAATHDAGPGNVDRDRDAVRDADV